MILRKKFCYKNYFFNSKTGELFFRYEMQLENKSFLFTEKIVFPLAPFQLNELQNQALSRIFSLAHIAFGISYYKAFCPCELSVESSALSKDEALFFNRFYESGLGEFAVRNNLNLQGLITFPFERKEKTSVPIMLQNKYLIPIGGGKDSCLTVEIMKKLNVNAATIAIGNARPICACMRLSNLDSLNIIRKIDPQLIELNQSGHTNGHVPITGMLAFLLWGAAILYNYQYVVLSCEQSANVGNLMQGNLAVNHQYSKSFEFEQNFYRLTQSVTPDFRYFSLLRPLSEFSIAKLFSQYCQTYFSAFTSCNKAFRLNEKTRLNAWCGTCDKCRFVFLILAPFLPRETLIRIIGKNLLDDETQLIGYKELLGLQGHKPFECVGEIEESRIAFQILSRRNEWKNDFVINALTDKIKSFEEDISRKYLTPAMRHLIPDTIADQVICIFNEGLKT